tara:strand:- start:21046 stop:21861 length:816 start_codon:yes stop_codon:yes gene_type:complete
MSATEYVVARSFVIGEVDLTLSRGETLSVDGVKVTRNKSGKVYDINSIHLAIKAGHILQNSDDVEIVTRAAAQARTKPETKIIKRSEKIRTIAKIDTPMTRKEAGESTTATTPFKKVRQTHRKVAKAGVEVREQKLKEAAAKVNPYLRDQLEARANAPKFSKKDPGVRKVRKISPNTLLGVVEKDETLTVETPPKRARPLPLNDEGFPMGYPHTGHWMHRIKWCQTNSTNLEALSTIYDASTESFQKNMEKTFPDITFNQTEEIRASAGEE